MRTRRRLDHRFPEMNGINGKRARYFSENDLRDEDQIIPGERVRTPTTRCEELFRHRNAHLKRLNQTPRQLCVLGLCLGLRWQRFPSAWKIRPGEVTVKM